MGVIKVSPFHTAQVTFKVIQGHWQWCHSIGHIRFSISLPLIVSITVSNILSLISQNLKRLRDSEHIPFGSNISCMDSYSSISITTRYLKCLALSITKTWLRAKLKNGLRVSDHTLLGVVCHRRLGFDTIYLRAKFDDYSFSRSCDIIGASVFKVCHVTLTTPILKWFVILMLGLDIAYIRAKFDHCSFSRSGDMVGAH